MVSNYEESVSLEESVRYSRQRAGLNPETGKKEKS